ncbi:PE family protein [Mycobacterium sp. E3198]|uniref:PE family protein n=1 Tax=Mycobacterium sp. E3198 TaxID=1834143 RepID=UPI0007FC3D0E|nr:PE family protein [Mycobacterium sp. E3198]OBG30864.1 hypothetical protein A5673_28010 [Mycobacterium sp. E3198]
MAQVIAVPEAMAAAAADLASVGSNLSVAHLAAAGPTVAVAPAAGDEVSAGIAQLFSRHAQGYQALAGQAAALQEQFVRRLTGGAGSYAAAEAANAGVLQTLDEMAGSFSGTVASLPGHLNNLLISTQTAVDRFVLHPLIGFWNDLKLFVSNMIGVLVIAAIFLAILLAALLGLTPL